MRTVLLLATVSAAVVASMAWSVDARAQLVAPAPIQAQPPGTTAPSPWGFPQAQPMAPMPAQNATAQQLDAADASKSFRGLEIAWVNAEAGGGYASLPSKLGYSTKGSGGPAFGLGVGGRFVTWTLGLRARVMPTSSFTLLQAMVEAGYHQPVGAWDPYIDIRGGYVTAFMKQKLGGGTVLNPGATNDVVDVPVYNVPNPHGVDLGLSVGDDYYLSAVFSLGLDVSFDTMFLSHASLPQLSYPSASGIGFGRPSGSWPPARFTPASTSISDESLPLARPATRLVA